jgi:RecA/RadA recombinase
MAKDTLAALWREYEGYLHYADEDVSNRMRFPTGLIALNKAIGDLQGFTSGIVQILGAEATGKTTLTFSILAASQKSGLKEVRLPDGRIINALFLDFERTFDRKYAQALGVDVSKVLVIKTPFAEQTFNLAERLLVEGIQLIIIDSIAMVIPESEAEKTFEDSPKIASEAQVIGRFLKRANQLADDADALVLVINQYRSNISAMARTEKKAYGAWILRHIIKLTVELSRIKNEDTRMHIQAFVQKNKMGAIGKKIVYEIEHGKGIDVMQHILRLAKELDIIQEKGKGRFEYNGVKAHGEKKALAAFPMDEIEQKVIAAMESYHIEEEDEDESITDE